MLVLENENRELYDRIQEQNLARQYDLLMNCVEIGLTQGPRAFDNMLWDLNHVAMANISQFGGRFREEPISLDDHKPPHFRDVPHLMDQFICTLLELVSMDRNRFGRLCFVAPKLDSPFIEGNGRTARAACYYLLCVRAGGLIGGKTIVPERIRANRKPYYEALREADRAWELGLLEFPKMEHYLAQLVQQQIIDLPA